MESHGLMNLIHLGLSFFFLAAYVFGLVVCILHRRASSSMMLPIIGFSVLLFAWLINAVVSAMYRARVVDEELYTTLEYVGVFASVVELVGLALIVGGLALVFGDVRRRLARAEEPAGYARPPRPLGEGREPPRFPGSPDIQR